MKQAGDGLLALCEAPGHELTEAGVQLRAGVHAGEVDLRGSDVGGSESTSPRA